MKDVVWLHETIILINPAIIITLMVTYMQCKIFKGYKSHGK